MENLTSICAQLIPMAKVLRLFEEENDVVAEDIYS